MRRHNKYRKMMRCRNKYTSTGKKYKKYIYFLSKTLFICMSVVIEMLLVTSKFIITQSFILPRQHNIIYTATYNIQNTQCHLYRYLKHKYKYR